jgi:hypothetical protein
MNSFLNELLELKARFDQWRANHKYEREPMPMNCGMRRWK